MCFEGEFGFVDGSMTFEMYVHGLVVHGLVTELLQVIGTAKHGFIWCIRSWSEDRWRIIFPIGLQASVLSQVR